ncbi:mevalonate kinase family protein [Spirochaeta cellobiosiphila]|uniref:mevalonate kinase family protein n=1 Tax=Spirochaeta cellobiosiphila TaxID=504483 RepID=UPI0004296AA4|nr:hypothetical protein [Spirochaeta cellobiosiphila]
MELERVGWGKLLLFGEHSAVQGYPALGMALPEKVKIKWIPKHKEPWVLSGEAYTYRHEFNHLKSYIESFFPELKNWGGSLDVISDVPISSGFGSSSALSVAIAKCMVDFFKLPNKLADIWSLSHQIEKHYHGKPSGIDTALSLSPGVKRVVPFIQDNSYYEELKDINYPIVYGSVERTSNTKELVYSVIEQCDRPEGSSIIKELGFITEEAIQLARSLASIDSWARLINTAHILLKKLNLGNHQQDKLIQEGIKKGAVAGKLSGAGGGGAFYLLFETHEKAKEYYEQLVRQNVTCGLI